MSVSPSVAKNTVMTCLSLHLIAPRRSTPLPRLPQCFFDKSNTANNAELVSGIKLMVVPRPGNVQETRPIRYFVLNLKMTPVNLRGPPSTPVGSPLQVGLRYYPPRRARLACCIQQRGTRHGFKTTLTC